MRSCKNFRSFSVALLLVVVTLMTAGSFLLAAADDALNKDCLEILKPIVSTLSSIGEVIADRAHPLFVFVGLALSALLCVAALFGRSAPYRPFLIGLAAAIAAQAVLIDRTLCDFVAAKLGWYGASYQVPLYQYDYIIAAIVGLSAYAVVLALCLFSATRLREVQSLVWPASVEEGVQRQEFLCLLLITGIGIILRVYAINHVTDYFEG